MKAWQAKLEEVESHSKDSLKDSPKVCASFTYLHNRKL
jgi:hypothetical protein